MAGIPKPEDVARMKKMLEHSVGSGNGKNKITRQPPGALTKRLMGIKENVNMFNVGDAVVVRDGDFQGYKATVKGYPKEGYASITLENGVDYDVVLERLEPIQTGGAGGIAQTYSPAPAGVGGNRPAPQAPVQGVPGTMGEGKGKKEDGDDKDDKDKKDGDDKDKKDGDDDDSKKESVCPQANCGKPLSLVQAEDTGAFSVKCTSPSCSYFESLSEAIKKTGKVKVGGFTFATKRTGTADPRRRAAGRKAARAGKAQRLAGLRKYWKSSAGKKMAKARGKFQSLRQGVENSLINNLKEGVNLDTYLKEGLEKGLWEALTAHVQKFHPDCQVTELKKYFEATKKHYGTLENFFITTLAIGGSLNELAIMPPAQLKEMLGDPDHDLTDIDNGLTPELDKVDTNVTPKPAVGSGDPVTDINQDIFGNDDILGDDGAFVDTYGDAPGDPTNDITDIENDLFGDLGDDDFGVTDAEAGVTTAGDQPAADMMAGDKGYFGDVPEA